MQQVQLDQFLSVAILGKLVKEIHESSNSKVYSIELIALCSYNNILTWNSSKREKSKITKNYQSNKQQVVLCKQSQRITNRFSISRSQEHMCCLI